MASSCSNLSSYLARPEADCVARLLAAFEWPRDQADRAQSAAIAMIEALRSEKRPNGTVESFFQTYSLNSQEGLSLMCLAEALLRIPDAATANLLIEDKIGQAAWGSADSRDWLLRLADRGLSGAKGLLASPLARLGQPVVRKALGEAVRVLGGQFVLGQTIEEAQKNAAGLAAKKPYLFSYDMLGEGARTAKDADAYFTSYAAAIQALGEGNQQDGPARPGISVKLSALNPRYTVSQKDRCVPALAGRLSELCVMAAEGGIYLTVDAEEVDRLELSLAIFEQVLDGLPAGWDGFGLAVQAYGKRASPLIENLIALAQQKGRRFHVRLVKGAYWDSEIKAAQIKGLSDYGVFTRKAHTDLSYLVCAQKMLQGRAYIYPMFGTHNAYTVQAILAMAGAQRGFEFQRLYGMGEGLYERILGSIDIPVRIYAPVGPHRDLLPYLVRRLLENGANSSFVNKVFDSTIPAAALTRNPVEAARESGGQPHSKIPLPAALFADRQNSSGLDLNDETVLQDLLSDIGRAYGDREKVAGSIVDGILKKSGNFNEIINPADYSEKVGTACGALAETILAAVANAGKAFDGWDRTPAAVRAAVLTSIAQQYEENAAALITLCVKEAGKTVSDALNELREAIDYCRYYAAQSCKDFDENGRNLPSYTGESNKILLQGRGVFACVSPWNFPLSIFTGQIVAALMAGNTVVAKPAEQTPFTAQLAVRLMHKAGVPKSALQLLIGGREVGEQLVSHPDIAGVAFTGSTAAAWAINRVLATKNGPIVPLIAETGGQNALIADSSSLIEQVIDDAVAGAFGAAGQRCSACRILCLHEDIADRAIDMLRGAMAELKVGDPQFYATDVGPVIDQQALAMLQKHKATLEGIGRQISQSPLPEEMRRHGSFFAPLAYEIEDIGDLKGEVFGPILHVVRYRDLAAVIKSLNATGYGLTFGLHTRIDRAAGEAIRASRAGNIYINRGITGAVVGVQPFGGTGLSGTGPKAGGPYYLHRFACEKSVSVNVTASGGNASLVMLDE